MSIVKINSLSKNYAIRKITDDFVEEIREKLKGKNVVNVLMSGGNTPAYIYQELNLRYSDFPWYRVRIIILDERYVPFSSPRSNSGECYRRFVCHHELFEYVYPDTNLKAEDCLDKYDVDICNIITNDSLDVALLGTAKDGHVASIFPGEKPIKELNRCFIGKDGSIGETRISLNMHTLSISKKIMIMAFGEEKYSLIDKVFMSNADEFPVLLLSKVNETVWYTDDELDKY